MPFTSVPCKIVIATNKCTLIYWYTFNVISTPPYFGQNSVRLIFVELGKCDPKCDTKRTQNVTQKDTNCDTGCDTKCDTKECIFILLWKFCFFVINKINLKHVMTLILTRMAWAIAVVPRKLWWCWCRC